MVDRRRIVEQWKQGTGDVLVTLVRIEGSSYRRPGAHLLIAADGSSTGTISGGCLEAEVVRKAAWKTRNGAIVETYSTLFDDTAEIPYGLGCGGIVDLLLEPVGTPEATPEAHALLTAMESSLRGTESFVATWLPTATSPLRRAVLSPTGDILFATPSLTPADLTPLNFRVPHSSRSDGWESTPLDPAPSQPAPDPRVPHSSRSDEWGSTNPTPFLEHLTPPQRLLVFGAGDDARPVATFAAHLGWSVTVLDGRSQLARAERFPQAERILTPTSPANLDLRPEDAVVLMTHSYEQDRVWLTALLASPATPGYIGLLGARHRSALLVAEAAAALNRTVAECCNRIWAPVGLDLGGDGPEAIALAIIAEIQASIHGRLGSSRRLTPAEVAEQIAKGGASAYLQTQCPATLTNP